MSFHIPVPVSLYNTIQQLRLMNFIRRIGRDEIYIKYVHQLVNVRKVDIHD